MRRIVRQFGARGQMKQFALQAVAGLGPRRPRRDCREVRAAGRRGAGAPAGRGAII